MAHQTNEGFRVLDEFACEAIPAPSLPRPTRVRGGVTEEISSIVDGGDELFRATIQQLASLIANSSDPTGAMAICQRLLIDQVHRFKKNGGSDS